MTASSDPMDGRVGTLLRRAKHVTGVAIVDDAGVAWSHVAGAPPDRLFQAGSISKCVTACAVLTLVDHGALTLDAQVNDVLSSWKLPGAASVSVRQLLGHTAGVNVPYFPGYEQRAAIPSAIQALDGEPPATTAPVRADPSLAGRLTYSGGAYLVVQQLVADVTGRSLADAARALVFEPLGMTASTFAQPLPDALHSLAARDDWHVYPEGAAAGLWTTPADLGRFVVALQSAGAGRPSPLAEGVARHMLTPQVALPSKGEWNFFPILGLRPPSAMGLGMFLHGDGRFSHAGGASSFSSVLTGSSRSGSGGVVMMAANVSPFPFRLLRAAAVQFGWDGVALPAWRRPTGLPGLRRFR